KDSLSRFVFGSAASALVVYLLCYGLSNPLTETVDKVYFAGALAAGLLAFVLRFRGRFDKALAVAGVLGFGIMVWGLQTVEHQSLVNTLWLGFGGKVTLAALLMLPLTELLLRQSSAIDKRYRLA